MELPSRRVSNPLGSEILIYLEDPTSAETFECRAEVVRHTPRGFAVRFVTPGIPFRRAVAQLRKVFIDE
ncbi:MAG: hypothetical protein R3C68_10295 [Myxococcota bacterium]